MTGPDTERVMPTSTRWHRKHASRLSRVRPGAEHMLWAPHRASWWIAWLFSVGSVCFLVAPLPPFLNLVGPEVVGVTFFKAETRARNPFVNFALFRNSTYTGATISNFLLNGVAGMLLVSMMLLQLGGGLSAQRAASGKSSSARRPSTRSRPASAAG